METIFAGAFIAWGLYILSGSIKEIAKAKRFSAVINNPNMFTDDEVEHSKRDIRFETQVWIKSKEEMATEPNIKNEIKFKMNEMEMSMFIIVCSAIIFAVVYFYSNR